MKEESETPALADWDYHPACERKQCLSGQPAAYWQNSHGCWSGFVCAADMIATLATINSAYTRFDDKVMCGKCEQIMQTPSDFATFRKL